MLKTVAPATASGTLTYVGTWNALTNNPTLTSGVGVTNNYYVVSTAGNTNLDGITSWSVGDWAIFNGTVWERVGASQASSFANIAVTSLTGYMYANGANLVTASTTIPVANVTGAVPNTVNVIAGAGLTGGGALTGNVTISVNTSPVTAGTYGSAQNVAQVTVNALGIVTSVTNVAISIANSAVSGLGSMSYQNANAVIITGGTENNVTYSNVTITSGNANFTTVNVAFGGSSSNIGSLSVGGFQNITADTGIIATFTGNSTTYAYTSLQNKNSSATAYGSYSLYNDTGTAYGDIGITSSTYSYSAAGFPNNAFSGPSNLFVQAGSTDLAIGTFSANAVHIIANGNVSITDGITVTSNNRVAIQFEIATKNNAYTLTTLDHTILANANTTPFTLTLPSAATSGSGRAYTIKKIDATANTVTISTTSAQTIDGASSYTINTAYSGVNLQSDGSNWWIIANLNGRNGTAGTF